MVQDGSPRRGNYNVKNKFQKQKIYAFWFLHVKGGKILLDLRKRTSTKIVITPNKNYRPANTRGRVSATIPCNKPLEGLSEGTSRRKLSPRLRRSLRRGPEVTFLFSAGARHSIYRRVSEAQD